MFHTIGKQDWCAHSRGAATLVTITVTLALALAGIPCAYAQGIITTIAGGGSPAGSALAAEMIYPTFAVVDKSGNLYVAAVEQSEILKIDTSGDVSVVAGNGIASYSGDGGPATSASLNLAQIYVLVTCSGLAIDSSGNLFISDTFNNRIRRVDALSGIITTVAGNGTAGYTGDGGPATSATINFPEGVAVDSSGNLFITDDGNDVIRRVGAATGDISTVAGTPISSTTGFPTACTNTYYCGDGGAATSAGLSSPTDVAVDGSDDLFIADQYNNVIRRVDGTTGIITTVAGNYNLGYTYSGDGSAATAAGLYEPAGIAVDASGDLFITDSGSNVIRLVNAQTQIITTVAGNDSGIAGYTGDGGAATSAELNLGVLGIIGTAGKVAVDSAGDIFIPDISNNRIRRVDGTTGTITTYAGGGSGGDGGPALNAITVFPDSLAVDASGNLYIDDTTEGRIRQVDASTGDITTVAGDGLALPFAASGDSATSASFAFTVNGIALDSSANLLISDTWDDLVLRVSASTGVITVVAGGGACPYPNPGRCLGAGYVGDGGAATSALLDGPRSLAVDTNGNLFIDDRGDNRIRRVDATTGIITTVAGIGNAGFSGDGGLATSAQLDMPVCMTLDSSNNILICDGARVRRVSAQTGNITTIAGNGSSVFGGDGGPATSAGIDPLNLAADAQGNIFIADAFNQRIRRVDASSGMISTVAGSGPIASINPVSTLSGDGGPATNATLNYPYAVQVDHSGNLYIADAANNRVREVSTFPYASLVTTSLSFVKQALNTTSTQQAVTLTNTGAVSLNISNISASGDFAETNNCPSSLPTGQACTINVTFTPTTSGSLDGDLTIADNSLAAGTMQTIPLSGVGFEPTVNSPPPIVLPPTPTTPQPFDPPASGSAPAAPSNGPGRQVLPSHPFSAQPILPATAAPAVRFSSTSLTFARQGVGTSSGTQSIVVVNAGPDSISSFSITASGDFTQTNSCTQSEASGASCTIDVTFKPTAGGQRSGTVTVVENGSDGNSETLTVTLSGTGERNAGGQVTDETPAPSPQAPEKPQS